MVFAPEFDALFVVKTLVFIADDLEYDVEDDVEFLNTQVVTP